MTKLLREKVLIVNSDDKESSIDSKSRSTDFYIKFPTGFTISSMTLESITFRNLFYNLYNRQNNVFGYMTSDFTLKWVTTPIRIYDDYLDFLQYLNSVVTMSNNLNNSLYTGGDSLNAKLNSTNQIVFERSMANPIISNTTVAGNYRINLTNSNQFISALQGSTGMTSDTMLSAYFKSPITIVYNGGLPDTITFDDNSARFNIVYNGKTYIISIPPGTYERGDANPSDIGIIQYTQWLLPIGYTVKFDYFRSLREAIYNAIKAKIHDLDVYPQFIACTRMNSNITTYEMHLPARRNIFNKLFYWDWGGGEFNKVLGLRSNFHIRSYTSELRFDNLRDILHTYTSESRDFGNILIIYPRPPSTNPNNDIVLFDAYKSLISFYNEANYGSSYNENVSLKELLDSRNMNAISIRPTTTDDPYTFLNSIIINSNGVLLYDYYPDTDVGIVRINYDRYGNLAGYLKNATWPFYVDQISEHMTYDMHITLPPPLNISKYPSIRPLSVHITSSIFQECPGIDSNEYICLPGADSLLQSDYPVSPLDLNIYNDDTTMIQVFIQDTTNGDYDRIAHTPQGFYDEPELISIVQDTLRTIHPDFTVSIDSNTKIVTVANPTIKFKLSYGGLLKILGMEYYDVVHAPFMNSVTGKSSLRVKPTTHIILASNLVSADSTFISTIGSDLYAIAVFPLIANYGEWQTSSSDDVIYPRLTDMKSISGQLINFKLLDVSGREIPSTDFQLSLAIRISIR